jgi:hypothetical protein
MPTTTARDVRTDRFAAPQGLSQQDAAVTHFSEILFIDPAVSDIDVLLAGVRPGVEAIVLDAERPAARQMAVALADRRGLDAVHIIAHGAPGHVLFGSAEPSAATAALCLQDSWMGQTCRKTYGRSTTSVGSFQ